MARRLPSRKRLGKRKSVPNQRSKPAAETRLGVPVESFETVREFAEAIARSSADDDDRRIHGSHPLVVFVESTLEAISRQELNQAILGLSRSSEDRLVRERRRLERRKERSELQAVLFRFESIVPLVRTTGYGGADEEASRAFFEEQMPKLLEELAGWADSVRQDDLARAATEVGQTYGEIADRIFVAGDEGYAESEWHGDYN